jgi:hypothetical protein
MKRSGRKSLSQTKAPLKEQIKGSKTNPKGSASSSEKASKIKLSEKIVDILKKKKEKYKIREDLVRSWGLGEIRPPSQQEKDQFFLYYHYLPWSYLIEVKKKYWNT